METKEPNCRQDCTHLNTCAVHNAHIQGLMMIVKLSEMDDTESLLELSNRLHSIINDISVEEAAIPEIGCPIGRTSVLQNELHNIIDEGVAHVLALEEENKEAEEAVFSKN